MNMINNPRQEPYFSYLQDLSYQPFSYSEKHYVFEKNGVVLKIARTMYNSAEIDESYRIEKAAHDLLQKNHFPVAPVIQVLERGEFFSDFAILKEVKIEGEICYAKEQSKNRLAQALSFMEKATSLFNTEFGFFNEIGGGSHKGWHEFLKFVAMKAKTDKQYLIEGISSIPKLEHASFIMTDSNMGNFIFEKNQLKCVIDIERPIWGDKLFLYAVVCVRNQYMAKCITKKFSKDEQDRINYYKVVYQHLFD